MAGNSALFRVNGPGETEATSKITGNVIEFNPSAVEDIAGRLVETTRQYSRDMSIHPNPNNPLNVIQDGKLGTVEMTIAGHIVAPNSVLAMADLDTLQRWMNEPATNSLVKFGRFAVRFDDISVWDQIPDADSGLILYDVFIRRPQDSINEAAFIAKLYLNGDLP